MSLDDMLFKEYAEFSLWDVETGNRSSSGILKMRYIQNQEYFPDRKWRPVCSYSDISGSNLDGFGQWICATMNFHSKNNSQITRLLGGEYDGFLAVAGYPMSCKYNSGEGTDEPHCTQRSKSQYCYIHPDSDHYFYQISCSCDKDYLTTRYGCKLLIINYHELK